MSSRKSYRNKMIRKDHLEVSFSNTNGGPATRGALLDVHGSGAAAIFQSPPKGLLQAGKNGQLIFQAPGSDDPFHLPVEVRSVRAIRGGIRVGFSFDQAMAFEVKWPETMRSLFNRRGAFRVKPRPNEDVHILIRADGGKGGPSSLRGRLADISLTGARVKLDSELPWSGLPMKVRSTFLLPETQVRVMVSAILRNTYDRDLFQVGLQFLEDNSPRFGINQKEIREYIMQRQREDLRRMTWSQKR